MTLWSADRVFVKMQRLWLGLDGLSYKKISSSWAKTIFHESHILWSIETGIPYVGYAVKIIRIGLPW